MNKSSHHVLTVFLVYHSDYECSTMMGVFTTKEIAEAFITYKMAHPDEFDTIDPTWQDKQFWGVMEEPIRTSSDDGLGLKD